MRFKSRKTDGYVIYAVSGINTISFAIDSEEADTSGLLGFAVERHDLTENERYFMRGYKVFEEVIPHPDENTEVSTYDHPVQSFVWDDFTAKPGYKYRYFFYPLKGKPKNLDRTARAISITVQTEKLYDSRSRHDVFFNRGVAGSQAYAKKFDNLPPDQITDPKKKEKALAWLARDLKPAVIRFIDQAKSGDTLLGCFYEFHYRPVLDAFKAAKERGVRLRLIVDAKVNEHTDKKGNFHESFPRLKNLKTLKAAGLTRDDVIKREACPSNIQHNKFIVFLKGDGRKPVSVWTGSTNISEGGLFGQTNVGHWIKDEAAASKFKKYWELLERDPGGRADDDRAAKIKKNAAYKKDVVALQADVPFDRVPAGITPIFSPRQTPDMLGAYARMLDAADNYAAITLAFGISDVFKKILADNTAKNPIIFLLLEKKDKPNPKSKNKYTYVGAGNNVYKAWGSYLKNPLYQWTKEVNTVRLGLNKHVAYIHSKFLLADPLGDDPLIITGSANFSDASTRDNDENMVLIRGNKRAADIYFTEFNRLFNHYYFRAVTESAQGGGRKASEESLFLRPNAEWLDKHKPGKLRYKRVRAFCKIKGITNLS